MSMERVCQICEPVTDFLKKMLTTTADLFELPRAVEPHRFARIAPTPYQGRAKFRARIKEGEGLDCFMDKDCRGELVVQVPARDWNVTPEIAGHVIATQIGGASRRTESGILKRVRWG